MNDLIEKVGIIVTTSSSDINLIYGVFDYSGYGKKFKPYVVRDFTKRDQTIGEFDTSEEADEFYIKVCRTYIAKSAIRIILDDFKSKTYGDFENAIDELEKALNDE